LCTGLWSSEEFVREEVREVDQMVVEARDSRLRIFGLERSSAQMAVNPNQDTEFNAALRAHGIIPPLPEPVRTPTPSPPPSPSRRSAADSDDDLLADLDDELPNALLEQYREARMAEMKAAEAQRRRFGAVIPIRRDDYTREVNDASMQDSEQQGSEGKGTGVVCFLWKDS
jgi:hypothetical protein